MREYAQACEKYAREAHVRIVAQLEKFVTDKSENRKREYLKLISDQEAYLSQMITQANG